MTSSASSSARPARAASAPSSSPRGQPVPRARGPARSGRPSRHTAREVLHLVAHGLSLSRHSPGLATISSTTPVSSESSTRQRAPTRLRSAMSMGSIPRSRQLGLVSFMGVSTNTQGLKATRAQLAERSTSRSEARRRRGSSRTRSPCSNHRSSAGVGVAGLQRLPAGAVAHPGVLGVRAHHDLQPRPSSGRMTSSAHRSRMLSGCGRGVSTQGRPAEAWARAR